MKFIKRWWGWLVLALVCLLLVVSFLVPAGSGLSVTEIRQHQSDLQLRDISRLVLQYKKSHSGGLPEKMSDLIPAGEVDYLRAFYAPNRVPKPSGYLEDVGLVDRNADYAINYNTDIEIIAFEKANLWPDGSRAICTDNLNVQRLTPEEFSRNRVR